MSVTDRIRKQLDQPDALTMESLEPLAEEYGEETRQVNARLAECIQLLRKGLRSEAIQRAVMKPNLLDWCAELEFPEIDDWLEILKFYGITMPPLLDRDSAVQLQEAIVEEQPLDELLRQHRRLAIAKAPLSWRLKVLRRLAAVDSVNAVWREDQQEWEVIRLKQIPLELSKAVDAGSLEEVQDLAAELARPDWVTVPSKELCKKAADAARTLTYKSQLARLRRLTERLHAAYSEGDETAAEQNYDAWQQLAQSMVASPPLELSQSIEPAAEWIRECRETREKAQLFEERTAALDNLLLNNRPLDELERAYYELGSLQLGIDELLEQRYTTRVEELRQSSRRQTQLRVTGVAVATLALFAAVGFWQWNRLHQATVASAVSQLESLIAAEDFKAAEGVIAQLQPKIQQAPEVVAQAESLKTLQAAEVERAERTDALIAELETDDASKIDANKLKLAEKEAKTDAEKLRVGKLRSALDDYEVSMRQIQSEAVQKAVVRQTARLIEIDQLPLESRSEAELDKIVANLNKLPSEFPKSLNGRELVDNAVKQAERVKERARNEKLEISKRQSSVRGLRSAATLSAFNFAVKNYVDALPADPISKQLSESLAEKKLWDHLDSWNQWCDKTGSACTDGLSIDELRALSPGLKAAIRNFGITTLQSLDTTIDSIITKSESRAALLKDLSDQFGLDENFGQLLTVIIASVNKQPETRRFLKFKEREDNADKINKLNASSKHQHHHEHHHHNEVEEVELRGKLTIYEEPRSTIRAVIRKLEDKDLSQNWEKNFLDLIYMIGKEEKLDGQLKEMLIYQFVKVARQGSQFMDEPFKKLEELFIDTEDKRATWFLDLPFNKLVSPQIGEAIREAKRQIDEKQQSLISQIRLLSKRSYTWVGAILPGASENKPEVWLAKSNIPDGDLVVLLPVGSEKSSGRIQKIGTHVGGRISLTSGSESLLIGRPVFLLPTDKSAGDKNLKG